MNNYIVLANKYRPKSLKDLIGQDIVSQTISSSVKNNRIPNAYIFSGTRGIGKTTIARIISRLINCKDLKESNELAEECGSCTSCIAFAGGSFPDVLEIDAASRTGVDDIREIIEQSKYIPVLGKYKIFIIDEVHMLSNNAFNALLKILEEPPAHVKFIFATTELNKIPLTILSRCQKFELKRIHKNVLETKLVDVCNKEGIEYDREAISYIVELADGSVRDSLSLLDRAVAFSSKLTKEDLQKKLGFGSKAKIEMLVDKIIEKDLKYVFEAARNIYDEGIEPYYLFSVISEYCSKKLRRLYGLENKTEDTDKYELPYILRFWEVALNCEKDLKGSPTYLKLEFCLFKLLYVNGLPLMGQKIVDADSESAIKEKKISFDRLDNFNGLLELLKKNGEFVQFYNLIENCECVNFGDNKISLKVNEFVPGNLSSLLQEFIKKHVNASWQVEIIKGELTNSIRQQVKNNENALSTNFSNNNSVKDILNIFENSKITDIK